MVKKWNFNKVLKKIKEHQYKIFETEDFVDSSFEDFFYNIFTPGNNGDMDKAAINALKIINAFEGFNYTENTLWGTMITALYRSAYYDGEAYNCEKALKCGKNNYITADELSELQAKKISDLIKRLRFKSHIRKIRRSAK